MYSIKAGVKMKYNKHFVVVNPNSIIQTFVELAYRVMALAHPLFKDVRVTNTIDHEDDTVYFILNPHSICLEESEKNKKSIYFSWDLTNAVSPGEHARRNYGAPDILAVNVAKKVRCLQTKYPDGLYVLPIASDMLTRAEPAPKKIFDVCFIGSPTNIRKEFVEKLVEKHISVVGYDKRLYGNPRDEMVVRSKIMLDIPRAKNGWAFFPGIRGEMAFIHKCLLISSGENYKDQTPYNVVFTHIDQMAERVEYYLEHEEERVEIVEEVYERFIQTTFAHSFCEILDDYLNKNGHSK